MNEQQIPPSDPAHHEQAIRRFLRRLAYLLTIKYSLTLAALWCFVWGTIAVALRAGLGTPRKLLLWGAGGIVIAIIIAAVKTRKQLPTSASIRSLLDRQNECGGLLMAAGEQPLERWQSNLGTLNLPRLRWRSARAWTLLAASIAFVGITLLVPVRFAALNNGRSLNVGKEAETLAAQIETLKEEQIITEAKAEELKDKLDQLGADANGEDPAKTWEALDHLANSIEKTAKEAAANAASKQEELAKAEALAEGLMAGADQMDAKLMTEAMQTLSTMMQGAMKENEALAKSLSPETQEAIKNGTLKPEQLKDVAKALGQSGQKLNQQMSKLNQTGGKSQINPNALKGGAQAQKRDNSGLSQFLKENAQKMSVKDALAQWQEASREGGKGGVDRGRGDAAMTWTEGSDEKNAKFKEKTLPPAAVAGLQDSQMVGLSAAAPEVQRGNLAAHGALNNAASGGGSAYTQTILPRHKGAVKRYFERK
ncbi:MAG: hypothetical protein ABI977_32940 [Acidobacteriota bacterium]